MNNPVWGPLTSVLLCLVASRGDAGVLAYYPFDTDFTDASASSNDLSIGNGTPAITSTPGEFVSGSGFGTGALDLDKASNEWLAATTNFSFGTSEPWSVSFWARRRPGAATATGMVVGDNTTTDSFIWLPDNSTVVQGLRFRPVGVGTSNNNDYATGHDTNFHHWVVVADGTGTIRVYRDNIDLGTKTPSGGTDFDIKAIGSGYTGTTQIFDGQIDELYIFDGTIGATTVAELFNGTFGTDTTPPTLSGANIEDDKSGGPVIEGSLVSFTVTFSEDMDAATFDAADFGNAGSAGFTIGAITEISPGVFTVQVTPTSTGTLQLQVVSAATLTDAAGNALDTAAAISSDTVLTVDAAPGPADIRKIHVVLLGGQSNALGRAAPSGLPTSPVNLQLPQDDVDFYESGLTTLRPRSTEFGPEITLGRRLADSLGNEPDTRVALIKYAVGGTDLYSDWVPGGDATTMGDGPRYVSFQGVVSNGLTALAAAYPNAVIETKGMLWVQGERDAGTAEATNYETNLTAFIADIRLTYGSNLWFVVSRLSSGQTAVNASGLATVRAAQSAVAAADPLTALLDTDGFGMKTDNLHFDALGQQQIGYGAAEWLLDFCPFLKPLTITPKLSGDFQITVDSAFAGFQYTLQKNPDLKPGNWGNIETRVAGGSVVTFTHISANGVSKEFFRVTRSMAP